MQIPQVLLEIQPIVLPRHPVNTWSRARTDRPVRGLQTLDGHVVQKRREPHVPVLPRHLAHTIQIT